MGIVFDSATALDTLILTPGAAKARVKAPRMMKADRMVKGESDRSRDVEQVQKYVGMQTIEKLVDDAEDGMTTTAGWSFYTPPPAMCT